MKLSQKLFKIARHIEKAQFGAEKAEKVIRLTMPYVGDRNAATKAKAKLDKIVAFDFGEYDHITYMGSISFNSFGKTPGLISMPVGFAVGNQARQAMAEIKRDLEAKKLGIKAYWE